jgi:hypothetical protein
MYGQQPDPDWKFDLSQVTAWSQYTFEYFTAPDSNEATPTTLTPALVETALLVTPVVAATSAAGTQQWHDPSPSLPLVRPGAPAADAILVQWLINPLAQRMDSISVYSGGPNGPVNSNVTTVPKGQSSQLVPAASGSFPAIGGPTDPFASRSIQWRYKMLDGSSKNQQISSY